MNMLVDLLPENVTVGGVEYPINTDFRTSILFEMMITDDELEAAEKVSLALQLYYPDVPEDIGEAVDKILWFYKCGKMQNTHKTDNGDTEDNTHVDRIYSFDYDDDYIFAAFMEQYGIDLQDVEYLHWWKFKALFMGLNENTEFCKIMGYRSVKISGNMSKEQRAFYNKMKEIHALPVSEKEQQMNDMLLEALQNGGDLTGLV